MSCCWPKSWVWGHEGHEDVYAHDEEEHPVDSQTGARDFLGGS